MFLDGFGFGLVYGIPGAGGFFEVVELLADNGVGLDQLEGLVPFAGEVSEFAVDVCLHALLGFGCERPRHLDAAAVGDEARAAAVDVLQVLDEIGHAGTCCAEMVRWQAAIVRGRLPSHRPGISGARLPGRRGGRAVDPPFEKVVAGEDKPPGKLYHTCHLTGHRANGGLVREGLPGRAHGRRLWVPDSGKGYQAPAMARSTPGAVLAAVGEGLRIAARRKDAGVSAAMPGMNRRVSPGVA